MPRSDMGSPDAACSPVVVRDERWPRPAVGAAAATMPPTQEVCMGARGSAQVPARLGNGRRRRAAFGVVAATALALAVLASPTGAGAAPAAQPKLSAAPLTPTSQ